MSKMRPKFIANEPDAVAQLTPQEAEQLNDDIVDRFGPDAAARHGEGIDEYVLRAQANRWLYVKEPRSALTAAEKWLQQAEVKRAIARGAVIFENEDDAADTRGEHLRELPITERLAAYKAENLPRGTVVPQTEEE